MDSFSHCLYRCCFLVFEGRNESAERRAFSVENGGVDVERRVRDSMSEEGRNVLVARPTRANVDKS